MILAAATHIVDVRTLKDEYEQLAALAADVLNKHSNQAGCLRRLPGRAIPVRAGRAGRAQHRTDRLGLGLTEHGSMSAGMACRPRCAGPRQLRRLSPIRVPGLYVPA